MLEILLYSGSQGSSSLKVSWQVSFRTLPEGILFLSIKLCMILISWRKNLIWSLKMVLTLTVSSLKDAGGTMIPWNSTNLSPRFSLLNVLILCSNLVTVQNYRTIKTTNVQCTRHQREEVCYQQQVTQQTSWCTFVCRQTWNKATG